jgi:hypothetical protein
MISRHTRRPVSIIAAAACSILSISFLRLNPYLDVRVFDAEEYENWLGGSNTTERMQRYMNVNHTNITWSRENNSTNEKYQLHNHGYAQNASLFNDSSVSEDSA